jgi:hypothetical protein
VAVAGLFLVAVVAFVLPFVTAAAPDRTGRATGLELVRGAPVYEGSYTHQSFEGEVEELMDNGSLPARVGLGAVLLALGLACLARRRTFIAALLAAALALIALVWIRSATATSYSPPTTTLRYGFWLTGALLLLAAAYAFLLLRRDRKRADEEDPYDVTPWTRYQHPQ